MGRIVDQTESNIVVAPIIRWAGSKSKLLDWILPYVPKFSGTYYEPFFGSGALFFSLQPAKARLSDLCRPLIETYTAVRDNPAKVIEYLRPLRLDESQYYRIRSMKPRGRYQAAAQFLYLNKACWNGLYRVNSRGEFNVPFGRPRTPTVYNRTHILRCASALDKKNVRLAVSDCASPLASAKRGDFVFLDPPYVTKHNLNGFAEWNEKIFSWRDQERLAELAIELTERGVNVMITNADHADVRALYPRFRRYVIERFSTLAGDMSKRVMTTEAIFCGGPAYRR